MPEPSALPAGERRALQRATLDTSVAVMQRQRRLEQDLQQANERLESLVQEKVALLKEVHHRVKNNLQVVNSLLRLEAARSSQTHTKAVLADMQGRIRSIALLHESLYRTSNFDEVDLGDYLRELCQQAFRSATVSAGVVRLELALGSLTVPLGQASPAGLLVNELIYNCPKHAFPQGQSGMVRVQLQPQGADGPGAPWCLSVSDTGVGLPPDFETRSKLSLGMQLVTDLARQMGGVLQVSTAEAPTGGAVFSIVFVSEI